MKLEKIEENLKDIRYFQRYEMHEEALEIANKIPIDRLDSLTKCKLYKLISLSYRKLMLTKEALININYAINIAESEKEKYGNSKSTLELGICMMNKGVIYDAAKDYESACKIYKQAISIFRSIDEIESGIMVNALINYGDSLCNTGKRSKALFIFREALTILNEKDDVRYHYLVNRIEQIQNINTKREKQREEHKDEW